MRRICCYCLIFASILLVSTAAISHAEIIIQHSGTTDPTTEGWTAVTQAPGNTDASEGPVTNDLGSGIDAWSTSINVPGTGNSSAFYESLSPFADLALQKKAVLNGWDFQMNVRVVTIPKDPDFAIQGIVRIPVALNILGSPTGSQYFQIQLGSQADGDPIAKVGGFATNTTIDLNGIGSGYHLYELRWSPLTTSAEFYVDGTKYLGGLTGDPFGNNLVQWGSSGPPGTEAGQGNFNFVQFSTVPEPSTLALLTLGAVGLLMCCRR